MDAWIKDRHLNERPRRYRALLVDLHGLKHLRKWMLPLDTPTHS
jgi:hypothetical protein